MGTPHKTGGGGKGRSGGPSTRAVGRNTPGRIRAAAVIRKYRNLADKHAVRAAGYRRMQNTHSQPGGNRNDEMGAGTSAALHEVKAARASLRLTRIRTALKGKMPKFAGHPRDAAGQGRLAFA